MPEGLTPVMATCDDDPGVFAEALDAVIAQEAAEPVLVADMSRGDDVLRVCEARSGVRHLPLPDSRGLSDSRNRAMEAARTRYLLFCDADAIPAPGWAEAMRRAFDAAEDVAVVGARCRARWSGAPPRLMRTAPAGDFLSLFDLGDRPLDVPRVVGTSFAIDLERAPREGFSLELGLGPGQRLGGEEVEFCERVRRDGWRIRYEPGALVEHHIPRERSTWRSMMRRVYQAGQEAKRLDGRLEPLPRELNGADRLFQVVTAPAFVAGRLRG